MFPRKKNKNFRCRTLEIILFAVVATTTGCISAKTRGARAATSVAYPSELRGTWDLGPESCKVPINFDADSPIVITANRIEGYENIDTLRSVERLTDNPKAWKIVSTSNVDPDSVLSEIYVLHGDDLVMTTGQRLKRYKRCHITPSKKMH